MPRRIRSISVALFMVLCSAAQSQETLHVLPETLDGGKTGDMMKRYLLLQVDAAGAQWKTDYETCTKPEDIARRNQRLREKMLNALGGFPERTPLNPQVIGIIQRQGYHAEKILFESLPRFYVTSTLYLPDADHFKPPYPGVLIPCGHSSTGKAHKEYQTMGASLASHGMAALVFDPIDQGERGQWLDTSGKPPIWGCLAHNMVGTGCDLLGQNTARFEIWDGMRALDYLVSRPEIDPNRIGITGNSGGGTQTSYLMALDDRIKAAAPSCYLHTMAWQLRDETGDAEQNLFGQLAFGLDMPDYVMMRAPMPVKMLTATHDFFKIEGAWECFRFAKRLYSRMGYSERVDLLENDEKHNYNQLQREAALRWLARWLLGRDEAITEPAIELIPEQELYCTPTGQVMQLTGARSAYDLNLETEKVLAQQRRKAWAHTSPLNRVEKVRGLAGIRPLRELPEPRVDSKGTVSRNGYTIEKLVLMPEPGIYLPALLFMPEKVSKLPTLYLHTKGIHAEEAPGGAIEQLIQQEHPVLTIDVRGLGETEQTTQNADNFGPSIGYDWEDACKAYVLGKTYVGMRAEDILASTRYLMMRTHATSAELVAVGAVGIPALHATALEPELFSTVHLKHVLVSWSNIVQLHQSKQQINNIVRGALCVYDLPDLTKMTGRKLILERPVDAQGNEIVVSPKSAEQKERGP